VAAVVFACARPAAAPQAPQPKLPLEEIIRHGAEKEIEYARAHALYRYELTVRVQEIGEENRVLGGFEQAGEVDFDPSHRRRLRLKGKPRTDLLHLSIARVELADLEFVPLFILKPDDIPHYDITYLGRERLDEVDTYFFRLAPKGIVRLPDRLFEGIIWMDADKLDIVRAHGRSLPAQSSGVFGGYFQRLELFREPVEDSLFTTFVRAQDVISARGETVRAQLTLRFSNYQRLSPAASPTP